MTAEEVCETDSRKRGEVNRASRQTDSNKIIPL